MDQQIIIDLVVVVVFYLLVAATLGGALIAILSARIIRSVSGLALSCLGLAGLYYYLNSPFVALMEILIYVGAVCVTIIFAIMLAEPQEPDDPGKKNWLAIGGALLISIGVLAGFSWLGVTTEWAAPEALRNNGSVEAIGHALLTHFSLVFELISLVLLVAIMGALVIARTGRSQS